MSNQRIRCMFCYLDSKDMITSSSEHLLSRPVAQAFGIDRESGVVRGDGDDVSKLKWARLNGIQRRCVCTACNNGWMNRLEHDMGDVADWLNGDPDAALGTDRALTLRAWALKTHMLLCFIDGNAGSFMDDTFKGECVIPPVTPARKLYEGGDDRTDGAAVGISRSGAGTDFAWSFGYPSVHTSDPDARGAARFAPATVLTVGDLMLWVVTPLLDGDVAAPQGVLNCAPEVRPRDLASFGHPLKVDGILVNFG